jgi:RHS repeat-associated protein
LYDHVQSLRYSYAELGAFLTGGIRMTFNKCLGVDVVIAPKPPFINIIQSIIGQNNPEPTFYYHTDHLGSSSYLTDDAGNITQTLNYLPYGETWVDIQTFNMIDYNLGVYLFNGKEKDQETGYNYFGARYYDDERISWLSVDPLSDKYPSISPYNYCMWNPVKYIDPNGEEIGDPLKKMKVRRNKISNTFGFKIRIGKNREKTNHQGIDYYAPAGTSTLAVKDGIVVWTRSEKDKKGYGNQILIKLNNENGEDLYAFYAHLSEIFVNAGDKVNEGDVIGKTGNTGNAFNMQGEDEHLHFELRETDAIIGGMQKRRDPNEIVDTKFEPDPNNKGKVRKVENNNPIKKHNDE